MKRSISSLEVLSIVFFLGLLVWWGLLTTVWGGENISQNLLWAATYQLMAWWGGLFGLITAKSWGGFKSRMGRTILYFSIGLIFQGFGQSAFSFYNIVLNNEIPYPSIADIGYFGSVVFYLLAILSLARIAGVSFRLKDLGAKVQAFVIPAIMLGASYALFLNHYEFDWSAPVRVLLDFGYPLGEACYVSVAMLALIFSRNMLGGMMKTPLLVLIFALIAQFVAEFNFLTQVFNETWINAGYGDVLYLFAYLIMTISLIRINMVFKQQYSSVSQNKIV